MIRSPIAAITIVSLVLLAVCCQILPSMHMHDAMESGPESMAHLMLLTISEPSSVFALMLVLAVLLWLSMTGPVAVPGADIAPRHYARSPDNMFIPPLRLALADGIIQPKAY
jgi:hypothetical protein